MSTVKELTEKLKGFPSDSDIVITNTKGTKGFYVSDLVEHHFIPSDIGKAGTFDRSKKSNCVQVIPQPKGISKLDKLKLCTGCEDNFYNGNNPYNVQECWCLKGAMVEKAKFVHLNMVPPWKGLPVVTTLSCYKKKQYIKVDPDRNN